MILYDEMDDIIKAGIKEKVESLQKTYSLEEIQQEINKIQKGLDVYKKLQESDVDLDKEDRTKDPRQALEQEVQEKIEEQDDQEDPIDEMSSKEICKKGILTAFNDCPERQFSIQELKSEIKAQFPTIEDRLKDQSIETYIYNILYDLERNDQLKKEDRGCYRQDYDLDEMRKKNKVLMDELCDV